MGQARAGFEAPSARPLTPRPLCRDADAEIERILLHQRNVYYVLRVGKNSDAKEVRFNYMRLSRLVHPDK